MRNARGLVAITSLALALIGSTNLVAGGPGPEARREVRRTSVRSLGATTTTTTTIPLPPPPPPPPPPAPPEPVTPEEKGAYALATIEYPWQQLGYAIQFTSSRGGVLGMTYPDERRINVYVRDDQDVASVAFVTAFELAHAIDLTYLDDARRATWLALRGAGDRTWFAWSHGDQVASEDATGAGDFSLVFAFAQTGVTPFGWRSQLAPPPDAAQLAALQPLFAPA